ncbi:MAG: hypothetical protein H6772_00090 [Pseudomonadales bacterium]|nr:hypothetical protein [Pseudomonadales bacterium]
MFAETTGPEINKMGYEIIPIPKTQKDIRIAMTFQRSIWDKQARYQKVESYAPTEKADNYPAWVSLSEETGLTLGELGLLGQESTSIITISDTAKRALIIPAFKAGCLMFGNMPGYLSDLARLGVSDDVLDDLYFFASKLKNLEVQMKKPYKSMTNQWPPDQLNMIEKWSAKDLAEKLIEVGPVVALRAIAEVMLNEDEEKLRLLLADDAFTAHWRNFESDLGLDESDFEYARKLEQKLKEM